MERDFFRMIRAHLRALGRRRVSGRCRYTDATILAVYLWAVINDRPTVWACDTGNWPPGMRRGPLPSQSTVSRRLRRRDVGRLLRRLERRVLRHGRTRALVCILDAKPMPIAGHSCDRQAGYGRAVRGKAKGYKLHAIIDTRGLVQCWRVAPMNTDERTIARRMLRQTSHSGYLLADANYDSNKLFALAHDRGVQLVTPRRYGPGRGLGHRPHHPARLRSRDLLETGVSLFGPQLYALRRRIEGFFGTLVSAAAGLSCLPAWVRTHRRVRQWVAAKLIINQLRKELHENNAVRA